MRRIPLSVPFVTLLFVVSQAHLASMLLPLEPSVLRLQLAFDVDMFWSILDRWGEAGVAVFRSHFPWDAVHPLLYGAMGWLLVTRTPLYAELSPGAQWAFRWMLPMAAACDGVENALHWHLLGLPHGSGAAAVAVSSTFSLVKWTLAAVFAVALAVRALRARRAPSMRA